MTKQAVKEFLKPTKWKVFSFSVSILVAVLFWYFYSLDCATPEFYQIATILLLFFIWPTFILIGAIGNASLVGWVFLFLVFIFALFYFYFMVCWSLNRYRAEREKIRVMGFKRIIRDIILTVIILFVIITSLLALLNFPAETGRARDSRIKSAISQARTVIIAHFADYGNYDSFTCQSQNNMPSLCQEVETNYKLDDGRKLVITRDSLNDSRAVCVYAPLYHMKRGLRFCLQKIIGKEIKFWYCADSTGVVGETNIDPGTDGFCVDGVSAKCPPIAGD